MTQLQYWFLICLICVVVHGAYTIYARHFYPKWGFTLKYIGAIAIGVNISVAAFIAWDDNKMKKEHEQILRLLQVAEDRNCTTCLHWQNSPELCTLYKQRPPASVIVKGCDSFDYVPF